MVTGFAWIPSASFATREARVATGTAGTREGGTNRATATGAHVGTGALSGKNRERYGLFHRINEDYFKTIHVC